MSSVCSSSLCYGQWWYGCQIFWFSPTDPWGSVLSFLFYLLLLRLSNLYFSSFKFAGCVFSAHLSSVNLRRQALHFSYSIFSPKTYIWYFFISSLLRLLIFSLILSLFIISCWNIFMMFTLKSLSDNSHMTVIHFSIHFLSYSFYDEWSLIETWTFCSYYKT